MTNVFNVSVMDAETKEELDMINVSVLTQLGELFDITDKYGQVRFKDWVWSETLTFKCTVNDPRKDGYDERYKSYEHNAVTLNKTNPYFFVKLHKKKDVD